MSALDTAPALPVAAAPAPSPASARFAGPRPAHRAVGIGAAARRRSGRAVAWGVVKYGAGPLVFAAAIVALWWAAVRVTDTSVIVAPAPGDVWHDFFDDPGTYLSAAWSTVQTAMIGLALGVVTGTLLAMAKWWSALLAGLTELPTLFFRSLPFVALIPVASRVLGYGPRTTIVITTIIAFFPSFALVDSGMRALPPSSADLLHSLGASKFEVLKRLAFPASMGQAATAIRLSATMTILGAMSSEYLTGSGGLGALYASSRITYIHPARGWTVAVLTALLSFAAFGLATALERRARARFAPL